jgi:hypothetical protein
MSTAAEARQKISDRVKIEAAVNPVHYARLGLYSAIHVIEQWGVGYSVGQTLKYIQRAGTKDGATELQDLKKAQWYLARRIHNLDPENEPDPAAAQ